MNINTTKLSNMKDGLESAVVIACSVSCFLGLVLLLPYFDRLGLYLSAHSDELVFGVPYAIAFLLGSAIAVGLTRSNSEGFRESVGKFLYYWPRTVALAGLLTTPFVLFAGVIASTH